MALLEPDLGVGAFELASERKGSGGPNSKKAGGSQPGLQPHHHRIPFTKIFENLSPIKLHLLIDLSVPSLEATRPPSRPTHIIWIEDSHPHPTAFGDTGFAAH